jgi:recombination protein RecT
MNQTLTVIDTFKQQIHSPSVQQSIEEFLPSSEMQRRFTAVTIRAVQENPDLLAADRKSLFIACQRAAQDGLMPDGREGAFVIYKTKATVGGKEVWIKKVQYQPMIQGIRKKLAKNGFHLAAEVYYEKDEFSYEKGDTPCIMHKPYLEGDAGPMKGAYAIATDIETGEKYREHMSLVQLEQVRATSKNPNGGGWKSFPDEMHRKSPAKRLLKYLPLAETDIFDIIARDNEQFDLDKPTGPSQAAKDVQEAIRPKTEPVAEPEPIQGEVMEPEKPAPVKKKVAKKVVQAKAEIPEEPPVEVPEPEPMPEPEPAPDETDPLGF